jgi:hypothetical protein
MDWVTGIQRAIDYIEENLTEELDYGKRLILGCIVFQQNSGTNLVIPVPMEDKVLMIPLLILLGQEAWSIKALNTYMD